MPDPGSPCLTVRPVFANGELRIDHVAATAGSERPTALRASADDLLVLPYEGVFATHFGRRDSPVTSANQALLIPAGLEHRYSYPGRVGDRCLAVRWTGDRIGLARPMHRLLVAREILERERLRSALRDGDADPLAVHELATRLRDALLATGRSVRGNGPLDGYRSGARRRRVLERVQAAIAADPVRRWTIDELAQVAALSSDHLTHVFTREVGTSLYEYVVRTRLGIALDAVLRSDADLAHIAADAGFASHSHFTARFRARFGLTPQAVRRTARGPVALRRIVTAESRRAS